MDTVLVLNSDYSPLNITTLMRGFKLVYKGKAEVLRSDGNPINGCVKYVRPIIIRLLNYVKFRIKNLKVNRHKIYVRDDWKCCYCGSSKQLTLDHVIPRSKGGCNSWSNLVTCCSKCNIIKANRTPAEAGMTLIHKPYEPKPFFDLMNEKIESAWNEYQTSFSYIC